MSDAWLRNLRSYIEPRGILRFVDQELKAIPDRWQEEALLLFESPKPEDRRISLQACVGPGKSTLLAWCGWWFLSTQGDVGKHPKGLVTAITGENLKDNLWSEYAKWQAMSVYLRSQFTWTATRIYANDHYATWFIGTRSWPKSGNVDTQGKTFSGLHSPFVMAQIDESGAIPTSILRAADQALSTCIFGKIIQAGNPLTHEGMLYAAATQLRHLWRIVRITGDPDDPKAWVHSPRVGDGPKAWSLEQIQTYGRDNPWVMAHVLGQFPPQAINALMSIEDVEAAMARKLKDEAYTWAEKRLGIDVARFGDDATTFVLRQGARMFKPKLMRQANTVEIAAAAMHKILDMGIDHTFVDVTGHWGYGVSDQLSAAGHSCIPIVYSDKSSDVRYENVRAFIWFKTAEWVKGDAWLPNDPALVAELTTPTYSFSNHGRMIIEPKELVKKRLGRSPDRADALAQTFYTPDAPAGMLARLTQRNRVRTNDDTEPGYASSVQDVGQADRDRDPW